MSSSSDLIGGTQPAIELKKIALAGFYVVNASFDDVTAKMLSLMSEGRKAIVFFANANFCINCAESGLNINRADVLLLNDGVALDLAAKYISGRFFLENLNGTDFWPRILSDRMLCSTVFLAGGKPDVVARAAENIENKFGCKVVGYSDGYSEIKNRDKLIKKINSCHPDIVLVALGNPLQEKWIIENIDGLDCKIISGVGALFDFFANEKPRAPKWIQIMRCEWLFRLALEPKRLIKRYTIDTMRFFIQVYRNKGTV